MSTCVNDRVKCLQLMASVCGTCESYAGIRRKILSMLKFVDELGVLQRMPACFNMLLTYTKLTHNVFDVCQCFRQIFHTLAKSSRCDSPLNQRINKIKRITFVYCFTFPFHLIMNGAKGSWCEITITSQKPRLVKNKCCAI